MEGGENQPDIPDNPTSLENKVFSDAETCRDENQPDNSAANTATARFLTLEGANPHARRPDLAFRLYYDGDHTLEVGFGGVDGYRLCDGRHAELPAPPEAADRIGTTFITVQGEATAIGLDLDGPNHANGRTPDQLATAIEKLATLPYTHISRSRSGKGYHVTIPIVPTPVSGESEQRAMGAAMVDALSDILQYNLAEVVDVAGGNLWVWCREVEPGGLEVLKQATEVYTQPLTPLYRHPPGKVAAKASDLEPDHQQLVEWLTGNATHNFQQCSADPLRYYVHTSDLLAAFRALTLRGTFTTAATGANGPEHNAWMRPLPCGEWLVGRYGVEPEWEKCAAGFRYCILNEYPELGEPIAGADEDEVKSECDRLGVDFTPPSFDAYSYSIQQTTEAIVITAATRERDKVAKPWRRKSPRVAQLTLPRKAKPKPAPELPEIMGEYSTEGSGARLASKRHGRWVPESQNNLRLMLIDAGMPRGEIDGLLGRKLKEARKLVNRPFEDEFPSDTEWNRYAARLTYEPAKEPGPTPGWGSIFAHLGRNLQGGPAYLRNWTALMLRKPFQRLPMLFFWSKDQNCGKSTFANSLRLLFTRGYCQAERAITRGFNGELAGAVLCDLDDADLSRREAYSRLQTILTSEFLAVEAKGKDTVTLENSTHWVQSANHAEWCPIQPGDTRIVAIEVDELQTEIEWSKLQLQLVAEAPYLLRSLYDLELPACDGRLWLPIIETDLKRRIMVGNAAPLDDRQTKWLHGLEAAARRGKLSALTTFAQLQSIDPAFDDAREFGKAWSALAPRLRAEGYNCEHRPNKSGREPAAWKITKGSAE